MDFRLTPEQERLRDDVRAFLRDDPAVRERAVREDGWIVGFDRDFSRRLGGRGWIGLTWPKTYGGAERSHLDRLIVTEELLRAGAPVAAHWFGDRQIGPALLAHGSEAQRRELLPRIVRAEVVFCIGMSEPNAGSDLAALETRAVPDGDHFVIRGQKTWTSFAAEADLCYLLVRTDASARPHRGISEILVPMDAPGVKVRPIRDMVGETHFGEIFFDDVRVPRASLIGEENRGWYQIMQQLDYERSGIERLLSNAPLLEDFKALAREQGWLRDPVLRDRLAALEIACFAGRQLAYKVAAILSTGRVPNREASAAKAICTEIEQRVADLVSDALGAAALLAPGAPGAPLAGRAARNLLYAPAYTIQGGTNNILRNIVATRALGLPTA